MQSSHSSPNSELLDQLDDPESKKGGYIQTLTHG